MAVFTLYLHQAANTWSKFVQDVTAFHRHICQFQHPLGAIPAYSIKFSSLFKRRILPLALTLALTLTVDKNKGVLVLLHVRPY